MNIIVLGDFILDEYVWGTTSRISPEAPVPIVHKNSTEYRLGGAANVVNNLHSLGAAVIPISIVGDYAGSTLYSEIRKKGIDCKYIIRTPQFRTPKKTRIVVGSHQMLRLDDEVVNELSQEFEDMLFENIEYALKDADVLVISDYRKGLLSKELLEDTIKLANGHGIPIVVDPKGKDFSIYKNASYITPNENELEAVLGSREDLDVITLCDELNLDAVVLTQAERGMTIYGRDSYISIKSHALEVFDVTGAGDTVVAAIAFMLAKGRDIGLACEFASKAAGVVVGKVGTSTVTVDEIESDFPKVKSAVDINTELLPLRAQGKKVVFTNGCFDLLHSGHVKLLQKAKTFGDVLIVAINSDTSVTRLKGPERPLISSSERAHLLGALDCVDYVTIFEEDTPFETIKVIYPDIIVKGGDYEEHEVVGAAIVNKVEIIDLVEGLSTSNIVDKIRNK